MFKFVLQNRLLCQSMFPKPSRLFTSITISKFAVWGPNRQKIYLGMYKTLGHVLFRPSVLDIFSVARFASVNIFSPYLNMGNKHFFERMLDQKIYFTLSRKKRIFFLSIIDKMNNHIAFDLEMV